QIVVVTGVLRGGFAAERLVDRRFGDPEGFQHLLRLAWVLSVEVQPHEKATIEGGPNLVESNFSLRFRLAAAAAAATEVELYDDRAALGGFGEGVDGRSQRESGLDGLRHGDGL